MFVNDIEREQTTKHKRYRVYGDRELQNTLLSLSELEWSITTDGEVSEYDNVVTVQRNTSTTTKTIAIQGQSDADELCAWVANDLTSPQFGIDPLPPPKPRKNERQRSKVDQGWKDWKDPHGRGKEIPYTFHHFTETEKYMEHYRKGHTYGQGGLQKEPTAISQIDNIASRLQAQVKTKLDSIISGQLNSAPTPRTRADPDILELQHKYKFDPNALKAANVKNGATQEKSPRDKCSVPVFEAVPTTKSQKSGRVYSAKSIKETIKARSSGTVNLTPTKMSPLKHKSSTNGKIVSTNNTNSIGHQERAANIYLHSNNIKTLDMLSQVGSLDKPGSLADSEKESNLENPCLTTKCLNIGGAKSCMESKDEIVGRRSGSCYKRSQTSFSRAPSGCSKNSQNDAHVKQVKTDHDIECKMDMFQGVEDHDKEQSSLVETVEMVDLLEECSSLRSRAVDNLLPGTNKYAGSTLGMQPDKAAVMQRYLTDLQDTESKLEPEGYGMGFGTVYGTQEAGMEGGQVQERADAAGITVSAFRGSKTRLLNSNQKLRKDHNKRFPQLQSRSSQISAKQRRAALSMQPQKEFILTQQGPVHKIGNEKAGFSVLRGFSEGPSIANGVYS